MSARELRVPMAIAAVVIVVDQLTKRWALDALTDPDRNIDIVGSLRFNLAFNTGMAFSRGTGLGPIIGIVALVVVVGLLVSIGRTSSPVYPVAVGLIIGGAVGNLLDRLFRAPGWFRGGVVDFIDVQWWPIFNVADIGVTVGGLLLLLSALRPVVAPVAGTIGEPAPGDGAMADDDTPVDIDMSDADVHADTDAHVDADAADGDAGTEPRPQAPEPPAR
ncbi:MAG: signal peptidase II [Ilumatobacteraceae bacterium]